MNSLIFSEAGSGHPAAGVWLYGVLGEAVKGGVKLQANAKVSVHIRK